MYVLFLHTYYLHLTSSQWKYCWCAYKIKNFSFLLSEVLLIQTLGFRERICAGKRIKDLAERKNNPEVQGRSHKELWFITSTILFIYLGFPVWDSKSVCEYSMHKLFACLYYSCFRNRNLISFLGFRVAAPSGIKKMRGQSQSHWKAHSMLPAAAGDNIELLWKG